MGPTDVLTEKGRARARRMLNSDRYKTALRKAKKEKEKRAKTEQWAKFNEKRERDAEIDKTLKNDVVEAKKAGAWTNYGNHWRERKGIAFGVCLKSGCINRMGEYYCENPLCVRYSEYKTSEELVHT